MSTEQCETMPSSRGDKTGSEDEVIAKFKRAYVNFSKDSLSLLGDCYDEHIHFIDPVHEVNGLRALMAYLSQTTENLASCTFDFQTSTVLETSAHFTWVMTFSHPKIHSGRPVSVPGASHIKFEDKITFHQDYYDMGAMIYEHIPLMGRVIRLVKRKVSGE